MKRYNIKFQKLAKLLTINPRSTAETCADYGADMLEFTVSDVDLPGSLSDLGNIENEFI